MKPCFVDERDDAPSAPASTVPAGKSVLNTHLAAEEHAFLKEQARARAMTVTMFLRNLIRREMERTR